MRYAHGILIAFLIPGIIFIGSAIIKLAGIGVTDGAALALIWNVYITWTFISIAIILAPLIVVYIRFKSIMREFLIFEAGGIFFFSPLWFILMTEVTGDSFIEVLLQGVQNGIAFPGPSGEGLIGVNIGPIFLIPLLTVGMIFGLAILRPSFIERVPSVSSPPELEALKEKKEKSEDDIDAEMPDVTPPIADSNSISELRKLLTELSVPITIIETLINAGIATVTDLISTSPESLAKTSGIDVKMAQDIHLAVQKKVWFGGIE